jgi:hypothetical protein
MWGFHVNFQFGSVRCFSKNSQGPRAAIVGLRGDASKFTNQKVAQLKNVTMSKTMMCKPDSASGNLDQLFEG